MRILAIDPGERRVGLAVSDELLLTAQGLDTFDKKAGVDFFDHVSALVEKLGVGEIVVGNPLRGSGEAGEPSRRAQALAARLRKQLDVTVTMWDERYSSQEAQRVLKGAKADKGAVDKLAAVIILQSYLDFRGSRQ